MQHAHSMAAEDPEAAQKGDRARGVAHFINEDRADMRGIKPGWCAVSGDGNLVAAPFTTYETCLERNPGQS
jgi:hypothetical protein